MLLSREVGALMLSLTHTVVTQATVGGAWRPECLAGEAVLEHDHLIVDDDLPGAWGRVIHIRSRLSWAGGKQSRLVCANCIGAAKAAVIPSQIL